MIITNPRIYPLISNGNTSCLNKESPNVKIIAKNGDIFIGAVAGIGRELIWINLLNSRATDTAIPIKEVRNISDFPIESPRCLRLEDAYNSAIKTDVGEGDIVQIYINFKDRIGEITAINDGYFIFQEIGDENEAFAILFNNIRNFIFLEKRAQYI